MDRASLEAAHLAQPPYVVELDGQPIQLRAKVFKTGSLGWHGHGKYDLDGTTCQVNFMITVVASKPGWVSSHPPKDAPAKNNSVEPVQTHISPGKAQEPPPEVSPLFPTDTPPKGSRKRSKGS